MNIQLVRLTAEYQEQLVEMLTEWKRDIIENHTDKSPWRIWASDFHDFDAYLNSLETTEGMAEGLVPDTTLFCLDRDRNRLVGAVNIRHYLNEKLLRAGGHIGDGIRPSERRKGYATAMLALALAECKKLGIDRVLVCCDKDNVGSAKAIVKNGGVLENEVEDDGDIVQRYWITISPERKTYAVPCIYDSIQTKDVPSDPIEVSVPGSKSITNRALLLATLAEGISTLRGVLFSDDSRHFLKCVQDLGFETTVDEAARVVRVRGLGGAVPRSKADLYVGSAGTAARFLTAFLGLSDGVYHMDASEQMRRRPMAPLLHSLKELGCEIRYDAEAAEGHFPFTLQGHGFGRKEISVNIDRSSQFLSALLIVSCLCDKDFTTHIEGTHGMAYIEITLKMMEQFGVRVERRSDSAFVTGAGQRYRALDYQIEPDVSAACYFYAMCPLLRRAVRVSHVHFDSMQGDVAFIRLLEKMGCKATDTERGILLEPPADGIFHGITADLSACSDQAITLAAIAPFADGPTTITGIGHIRFQESDRIAAIAAELTKMGIRCEERKDSITVWPGKPLPTTVETYEDHRMAMGFSLTGLRSQGIVIADPDCCRKTFEDYFEVLEDAVKRMEVSVSESRS